MSNQHIDLESNSLFSQREQHLNQNQPKDILSRLTGGASTEKMLDTINIQRKQSYYSDCIFNMAVFTFYSVEFFYAAIVLHINVNRGTDLEKNLTTGIVIYDLLYLVLITLRFWHESLVKALHHENMSLEANPHHVSITGLSVKEIEISKYTRTARCYIAYKVIFALSRLFTVAFWLFACIVCFNYGLVGQKSNSLSLKAFLMMYGVLRAGLLFIITLLFISQKFSSSTNANLNRRLVWSAVPAEESVIDKIEVKRYSADMEGNNECSVCLLEYTEGESIMVLKCDPRHFFHARCASKWFRTNGVCPICRERV